jgi:hypothetical protein
MQGKNALIHRSATTPAPVEFGISTRKMRIYPLIEGGDGGVDAGLICRDG